MALTLEKYIESLAVALKNASELKQWEIPMTHRTKDTVSAYKASVGMVGAMMLKVLRESTGEPPAPTPAPVASAIVPPIVEEPVPVEIQAEIMDASGETEALAEPEAKVESFFEETDRPRRRRERGQ
jgi:hypothetical protein